MRRHFTMMKVICFFLLSLKSLFVFGTNCHCADDWPETTLPKRISAFKDVPVTDMYEYIGVEIGVMNSFFRPCICTDVLRLATSFTIADTTIYNEATADVALAQKSVESTITSVVSTLGSSTHEDLLHRLESVDATYGSKAAPKSSTYSLKIILRGSNSSLAQELHDGLNTITLPNSVTISSTTPTVSECPGDPADPPNAATEAITKDWNGVRVPPTKATYKCPQGKYISPLGAGEVECDHSTLQWTSLEAMSCTDGCGLDPPDPIMNGLYNWDNTSRGIGHIVTYYCENGYGSGSGNATSKCDANGWAPLPLTYFCVPFPCKLDISQTPSNAVANITKVKGADPLEVTYSCDEGYRPTTKENYVIKCIRGQWTKLPDSWKCINIKALSIAEKILGDFDLPDNQLTQDEIARRNSLREDYDFFLLVTVPSIGGMITLMLMCLCCTRISSPLFNVCRGYAGSKGHKEYSRSFGRNHCS